MNADVLIWGPIGNYYILKGKGSNSGIKQRGWADLEDAELEDAINWCIESQLEEQTPDTQRPPRVYIYSESMYAAIGSVPVGKLRGGGGTMYHYMIVSDEKIESQEQAEAMVKEAIRGPQSEPSSEVLEPSTGVQLPDQNA